jgi:hypothetical protein
VLELRSAVINNRDFLFCLIARRSRHRVGTRYFTRGIDGNGNVANFNETEQIVLLDPMDDTKSMRGRVDGRERLSFVQIRGSVPVYWAEINNLRYKPDLQIMDIPDTVGSYRQHMHQLVDTYGSVYSLNLVNQKGYEKPVKEAFETVVNVTNNTDRQLAEQTKYIYWDFHAQCKGMRFDRSAIWSWQLFRANQGPQRAEGGHPLQLHGLPRPHQRLAGSVRQVGAQPAAPPGRYHQRQGGR